MTEDSPKQDKFDSFLAKRDPAPEWEKDTTPPGTHIHLGSIDITQTYRTAGTAAVELYTRFHNEDTGENLTPRQFMERNLEVQGTVLEDGSISFAWRDKKDQGGAMRIPPGHWRVK